MGYQVIRQPDGLLAVYSSFTDPWAVMDTTPAEVVDWLAARAEVQERREMQKVVDHVTAGEPRKSYYQFTRTFDEANAMSEKHGGEFWRDGEWHGGDDA
jgi:hypothetical protein